MTETASMYATCEDCQRTMNPHGGCTMTHVSKGSDQPMVKRIFYGQEADDWGVGEGRACHDCNAGAGQPHHSGCDVERCPECGAQMLMCLGEDSAEYGGCGWTHLYVVSHEPAS